MFQYRMHISCILSGRAQESVRHSQNCTKVKYSMALYMSMTVEPYNGVAVASGPGSYKGRVAITRAPGGNH